MRHQSRRILLACTALAAVAPFSGQAYAQAAINSALDETADEEDGGLTEIIVTAQKREQSVQDVPVAVTALSPETLLANRVTSVADLSGLAPGVVVRPAAGGSAIPSFSMRGITSYGVVPGSDKQVSVYLDGVYISSPRGSIFDLPDVERIEVLRGPQGTLFGRNATAGAVSVSTRDPRGEFGVRATGTYGNYDQFRFGIGVDLPEVGPFSAYLSYQHNYKRGDIRNAGAGQVWDRRASAYAPIATVERSPDYLGTIKSDTWFAAVKFESGDFRTVYKYDRTIDDGTPEGTAPTGFDPGFGGGLLGGVISALVNSQPTPVTFAPDGLRPDVVSNSWAIPKRLRVEGHSLTSTWQVSDSLTLKNIAAIRKSEIFSASSIDGLSALTFTSQAVPAYATFSAFSLIGTPTGAFLGITDVATATAAIPFFINQFNPLVGSPFVVVATAAQSRSEQWSDELQLNYTSSFVTATAGAQYFHSKDYSAEHLLQNTPSFVFYPGGVIRQGSAGRVYNEATSLAAYAQLEFHLTPQLDVVLGGRITNDKKSGTFEYGTPPNLVKSAFTYNRTKPTYLVGVNYRPTEDILLYAKYSTGYVSGGAVSVLPFEPETVRSFEAGIKAEMFDRRLRANLAVWHAKYSHVQAAQGSTNFAAEITALSGDPNLARSLGTFIADAGTNTSKGFELDITARPVRGLTIGGSLGYTDVKYSDVPAFLVVNNGGAYDPILIPEWTGSLFAQFDTRPLGSGDAYVSLRADAIYQSEMPLSANRNQPSNQTFMRNYVTVPSYWLLNSRVALKELYLGGVKTELAVWGKNLTDRRYANFALDFRFAGSANFIPARTYGVDLAIKF